MSVTSDLLHRRPFFQPLTSKSCNILSCNELINILLRFSLYYNLITCWHESCYNTCMIDLFETNKIKQQETRYIYNRFTYSEILPTIKVKPFLAGKKIKLKFHYGRQKER